jgi:hypothetical protein
MGLIVDAFMSADIPLYKLRTSAFNKLFNYLGNPLLFETSTRRSIDIAYNKESKE